MNNSKVYIIVLNYKNPFDTIECLESIYKSSYTNYQVIVVDNDSKDESIKLIKKWADREFNIWVPINNKLRELSIPPHNAKIKYAEFNDLNFDVIRNTTDNDIILINSPDNQGYAAGNNIGIRYALHKNDFDYIWILNNDTVIDKFCLAHLVNSANNSTGIIGSKMYFYHYPDTIAGIGGLYNKYFFFEFIWFIFLYLISLGKIKRSIYFTKNIGMNEKDEKQYDNNEINPDFVMGASMFVSKRFLNDAGLMDELNFLFWEELNWCRMARENLNLQYCSESKLWHKEGAATKKNNEMSTYYSIRNMLFFTKKFHPLMLPFNILFCFLYTLKVIFIEKNLRRAKFTLVAVKDFWIKKRGKYNI